MRARTITELPRLALVAAQLAFTMALWYRVEALAEMALQAQKSAESAANWAQALADDNRKR